MKTLKRILQVSLVCVGAAYVFGCSGAANAPVASNISTGNGTGCPSGIGGMDASCCDGSGTVISPPTSATCGVLVPGVGGVANPINGGASAGSAVGQTTAAAASLAGGQSGIGGLAGESAATAGAAPVNTGTTGTGIPFQGSKAANNTSGNANSGTGGGSGSGDTSGSVSTAPAAVAAADSNTGTGSSDATGVGQYDGGGGGAGLLPNGAHATGFQFGNGFANADGSGAANAAQIGFGAERNPASMAGEDPSDYFTRIGLADSLFKKVEKRYRSTAANWETASLSQASAQIRVKAQK